MRKSTFWYEELSEGKSWLSLWYGYIRCGNCRGIRTASGPCPNCNSPIPKSSSVKVRTPFNTSVFELAIITMQALCPLPLIFLDIKFQLQDDLYYNYQIHY
jgi:hypothetical protein